MTHVKKLEVAVTDHTTSRKSNDAESDYMQPYSPFDEYYHEASTLSNYIAYGREDVDMIQDVLLCNKAMK